jgi:uncharacterized protein (DUF1684 family)
MRKPLLAPVLALSLAGGLLSASPPPAGWAEETRAWREKREARLRSPDGWLALVGLHWLPHGEHRFGSAKDNDVVLAAGGPARAGRLIVAASGVTVVAESGALVLDGRPLPGAHPWRPDDPGPAEVLEAGRLRLTLIRRGGRLGIRVRDPESPVLKDFRGMPAWPIDPRWRVVADWEAYPKPRPVAVPTVLGTVETLPAPGAATFTVGGKRLRLEPVLETDDARELFFIFKDATSGRTSYGAGRFLYSDLPRDGKVVLDFNRAYNPPCAFTPYATCPLPPRGNRLSVPIEAGEKRYGH